MKLLKAAFNLNITKEFIAICEAISKQNPNFINNGIGVNFSKNQIESIKIYYGFHHKLSKADVENLHFFGNSDTFWKIESLLAKEDYKWHEYIPTGISFALKIDKDLNISIGHFMMPKLRGNDVFFSLPKVIEYYKSNSHFPIYKNKGIFTLIDKNGVENSKDYYYVEDMGLKDIINQDFNIDIHLARSVEWAIGKGFYTESSKFDEKIVLQSNYEEVYNTIIKKDTWNIINEFSQRMLNDFGLYCVCPGYYKNKKIKSYYYFNGNLSSSTIINTIPKIIKHSFS